jgi:hypothetical protein
MPLDNISVSAGDYHLTGNNLTRSIFIVYYWHSIGLGLVSAVGKNINRLTSHCSDENISAQCYRLIIKESNPQSYGKRI